MVKCWKLPFLVRAGFGAMVGILISAIVAYLIPREYESEGIIEVRPIAEEKRSLGDGPAEVEGEETPDFLVKAAIEMKGGDLLAKIVGNLELAKKWGVDRETAIRVLIKQVTIQNIRTSDLIAIRVRNTDRVEARDIANEVARVYKDYRDEIGRQDRERMLLEAQKAVKDEEEKWEAKMFTLAEADRKSCKNIEVEGLETLLHLDESEEYSDARREHGLAQQQLEKLRLEAINLGIFRDESVLVHEDAQIAELPVSPNVSLILTLGAIGGMLLFVFLGRRLA